ncbi:MAG: sigma 54-interacting transcriptional regulator [Pirellulaceae bacterium]|jgi:transcriptional regulator with GAF, ATPase, and Fis domain|nr:sigma 54-interacting transcriptional regulator [Pirellulaceae bacterium]
MHRQVETKITRRHGNETSDCYVLVSTAVAELLEGPRILVCLEDITARKLAELALRDALEEVERLKDQLQRENMCLREEIRQSHSFEEIVGQSLPLQRVLERIEHVAPTSTSVLILGETGTGKELIARAIHHRSTRHGQPLVTMNCAAVPASLLESELFGYVAGAFTGAVADKPGRFALAHQGTIFLDEVAELPLELQAKLLRVLERGELWVLGSTMKTVDVRVIAATNRDLRQAVAAGTFRADLYYRLAVFPVDVPPLRARRNDIPLLAAHFLAKKQAELGRRFDGISADMLQALVDYDWPGNVRELQNVIERSMILSPDRILQLDAPLLPSLLRHSTVPAGDDLASADRSHITRILEECGWKIKGAGNAAERLQLNPSTLRSRMKKLGIVRH